jgi:NAD(P)-dependent dehydrogenase (short-subunit alcohol dehydrogenase family)
VTDLCGQVAVVTGGGRGLGRIFAETLASAGAKVFLLGRSQEHLAETVAAIGSAAQALCVDVTDAKRVTAVFEEIGREIGLVDLLVNNAGVLGPLGPFASCGFDEWWRAMEVNVRGAMLCTHAVLPGMIERRRGRIINLVTGAFSAANLSAYLTSKTAMVRATECLAAETRAHGLVFFSFAPGTVWTDMSKYSVTSPAGLEWIPWFHRIFDEGLNLEAERPAWMLVALASGKYDMLTGLFLSPFDDLDALLAERAEIEKEKLHTLQLRPRYVSPAAARIAAIRSAGGSGTGS